MGNEIKETGTVIITFQPHLDRGDLVTTGVVETSHDGKFFNLDRGLKGSVAISKNEILTVELKLGEEDNG